jgi:hypothetical protein
MRLGSRHNCENFWSLLKRAIRGTDVSVEPFHLFMNDAERFAIALTGIINKRLTYTNLTGSRLPQTC